MMKSIMENLWFHVVVHSLHQGQQMIQRATEPLIGEWWSVARKSSTVPIVEVARDSLVGHPKEKSLVYAPPAIPVTAEGVLKRVGDVKKCAAIKRVCSLRINVDVDELAHPQVEKEFKEQLEAAPIGIAHELEHTGIAYAQERDVDAGDVTVVATWPQMWVELNGFLLKTYLYALGGPLLTADLNEPKRKART